MSSPSNTKIVLTHFNWSIARLKEAIEKESTDYYRSAALHRFSLTCNVAIESIRIFAKEQGKICSTDESCFQWVKEKNWLENNVDFKFILEDYQKAKNPLKDIEIKNIYTRLNNYFKILNHISECMKLAK